MASNGTKRRRSLIGSFIVAAIAYIVLGVFMVANSKDVANGLVVAFGIIMLIYGIINIISFFLNKDSDENLFMELALGVIAAGLGVFALVAPNIIQQILFYTIGAILIIDGIINVKRAFSLKHMGFRRWTIPLAMGAIGVVLGVVCIILYMNIADAVVIFMGISLIYEGIVGLVIMLFVARTKKKVEKELALAEK